MFITREFLDGMDQQLSSWDGWKPWNFGQKSMNNVPLWQYKREDDSALRSVFSSPLLVIFSENLFSIIRSLLVKRTRLTEWGVFLIIIHWEMEAAAAREWNSTKADEIFSPILIGNVHQEKVVAYRPPLVTHFHTEFHFCIWFDPLSFLHYWALKEYLAWNADKQIKVKRD